MKMLRILFLGLPAAVILIGAAMLIAAPQQAPRDDAAAQVFRSDPSCAGDLGRPAAANGACSTVDATVIMVDSGTSNNQGLRHAGEQPWAQLRLADGSEQRAQLSGSAGRAFVRAIYPGTAGRAQLFHGTVVRVAANGIAAESMAAPDVMASSDAALPWLGAGLVALGLIAGFASIRLLRRITTTREGTHA